MPSIISPRVFICYRRADTVKAAAHLGRQLTREFGRKRVFLDEVTLEPGTIWLDKIDDEVPRSSVLLVLIGPEWLKDEAGKCRLDNPQDVVRREIALAFKYQVKVIPVLVGGGRMPSKELLPEEIAPLTDLQAGKLGDDTGDLAQLVRLIRKYADFEKSIMGALTDPDLMEGSPKAWASLMLGSPPLWWCVTGGLIGCVAILGPVIWLLSGREIPPQVWLFLAVCGAGGGGLHYLITRHLEN